MTQKKLYDWAIVGAGPGGITAVGLLLDSGVKPSDILWIDPEFQVGDFGKYWGEVNSNTTVACFQNYLNGAKSFNYAKRPETFAFDDLNEKGFTFLKEVTKPLLWITEHLKQQVDIVQTHVCALKVYDGCWQLETDQKNYQAKKVILAIGAEPKSLDHTEIEKIDLITALAPSKLAKVCKPSDVVAVFGSSHSSMIVIRHLIEAGVENIVNFYLNPLRYAIRMGDWTLYDNTGLKGETAKWVSEHISKHPLPSITRHLATPDNIETYLPSCNKVVYTIGFHPRHIPVQGISLADYDASNGIIAPGLFGVGIAFPKSVMDQFGNTELDVGLWKFLKNMKQVLPVWQQYGL